MLPHEYLIDLLFPRCCPVCGDIVLPKGENICPGCISKLSFVTLPVCKKCGKELEHDVMEYCFDCSKRKKSFETGFSLLNYDETASRSMAKIKYKNKREYLDFYGEALALRFGKQISRLGVEALVPVPVHPSRKRMRGFNQAEVLAEKMSRILEIPVEREVLFRSKKTTPQKQLNPAERLHNLEQAFLADLRGRRLNTVVLVDDIYTTGSTAEACTRVLQRAGVGKVYLVTICIGRRE